MSQSPAIRSGYRSSQPAVEAPSASAATRRGRKHTRSGTEYEPDGSSAGELSAPFVPTVVEAGKMTHQQRGLYSMGIIVVLLVIFGSWFFPQRQGLSETEPGASVAECSALQGDISRHAQAQEALREGQMAVEARLENLLAMAGTLAKSMSVLSDVRLSDHSPIHEHCPPSAPDAAAFQHDMRELQELLMRKDELFREEYDVVMSEVQVLKVDLVSVIEAQKEYIGVLNAQISDLSQALETEHRHSQELSEAIQSCITEERFDSIVADKLRNIPSQEAHGEDLSGTICFASPEALREAVDSAVRDNIDGIGLSELIRDTTSADIERELRRIREAEETRLAQQREHDEMQLEVRAASSSCDKCISLDEAKNIIRREVSEECSSLSNRDQGESDASLTVAEPDHAQRGAGATVVPEFTSATYARPRDRGSASDVVASVWDSMSDYFGLENGIGRPEDALSHRVSLGQCWAMNGTHGVLTIQLAHPVHVTSVTVDHVSRHEAIDMSSAPKDFEVFGLRTLESPRKLIVRGSYDAQGPSAQTFRPAPPSDEDIFLEDVADISRRARGASRSSASKPEFVRFVSLRIRSNYGNPDYTCLYRFRVHGEAQ